MVHPQRTGNIFSFAPRNRSHLDQGQISSELYEHYVERRKDLALKSRTDIAGERYPSRKPNNLSKDEWEAISQAVNARFRELLISEFPDNHFQLNELYISRKRNQGKPQ